MSPEVEDAGAGTGAASGEGGGGLRRPLLLGALAAAVVGQLVVLYAPSDVGPLPFAGADKLVHVLVFLVPVALALVVGVSRSVVVAVFAGHAVLSEVVQAVFLPQRSGDGLDAVADLVGVGLGVLVGHLLARAHAARGAG